MIGCGAARRVVGDDAVECAREHVARLRRGHGALGAIAERRCASDDRLVHRPGERQRPSRRGARQCNLGNDGRWIRPSLDRAYDRRSRQHQADVPASIASCVRQRRAGVGRDDVHGEVAG